MLGERSTLRLGTSTEQEEEVTRIKAPYSPYFLLPYLAAGVEQKER